MIRRLTILAGIVLSAAIAWPLAAPGETDFSGTWRQDGARSLPPRSGDVTLRIEHRDPALTVETTILDAAHGRRHAVQRYTTDGRESVTTGADGDRFQTVVIRDHDELVFTIVEHEDGRVIHSTETWSLIDGGATLRRLRHGSNSDSSKHGGDQIILYSRTGSPGE